MLRLRGLPELIALGIWTFLQLLHADRHLAVSGLREKSWGWVSAQARVNWSQRLGCIVSSCGHTQGVIEKSREKQHQQQAQPGLQHPLPSPDGWPSCRGRRGSAASQVPTLVGGLAGEAESQPGGLQGQRVGPVIGDTPY